MYTHILENVLNQDGHSENYRIFFKRIPHPSNQVVPKNLLYEELIEKILPYSFRKTTFLNMNIISPENLKSGSFRILKLFPGIPQVGRMIAPSFRFNE